MTNDPAAPPRLSPPPTPPAKVTIPTPRLDAALERHLAAAEVADRLDVSLQMVRKMIRRGELPAVRFGNRVRIPEAAVLALLTPVASAKDGQ